ncbi:TldD/PmbA family protein [Waterburya agarophytonicola K14]|uniref:TldD/PmbA family protein n=1 Tax=Waterburya agarophytonicola KI4 TaxID=2874699 RepID=A0A964FG00_9CYAN|nr:TldD/PmbA family protein [Waterburya agarophytonicola]MCC0176008.1 TldD/PmbA family protein [Waterburya agarophytonicola KI4]
MTSATLNSFITQSEALALIDFAIAQSQADGVFVSLDACEKALSRFSENQISQNVRKNTFSLTITSYFGKRSATASTTQLDRDAIALTVKRAEDLATIAPEDPEWVELLPEQTYSSRIPAFDPPTATLSPLKKGQIIQQVCSLSQDAAVNGSGTLSFSADLYAIGNSAGLRSCDRSTEADFSYTARIDNGSSWNRCTAWSIEQLPIMELTKKVIERAIASRNPQVVQPDDYTVVFEPSAFASLLPWVIWNLDARAADEGRSFMSLRDDSGKPIGSKVGDRLFSPMVQIQRNSAHPLLQGGRFFGNGLPNEELNIIRDGIPQTLAYSRYWAKEKSQEATGVMSPIVMAGSDKTVADLVASTERGIFVSRAWYVRYVNPRTLEVTGMTRDGTFLIENGKISYPIKNLRFNQCLPEMLNNIVGVSRVKRCGGSVIPGCKVENFHFSSITDSI